MFNYRLQPPPLPPFFFFLATVITTLISFYDDRRLDHDHGLYLDHVRLWMVFQDLLFSGPYQQDQCYLFLAI
jgi:hypothetical protein